MPLHLYIRNGVWHVRGSAHGQVIRRSTRLGDKRLAEALKTQWETEALERSVYGAKATATFAEAAVMYMKAGGERRFLTPIIKHFGKDTKLKDIKQAELDIAAATIYPNASNTTRRRQFYTPVIAVLNYAAENDLYDWRKFKRPKEEEVHRSVPTDEWWLKVLPECSDHLAALLLFLSITGARISEACRLMPEDVDPDEKTAILRVTKTGKPRKVDIPDPLWARMAPLLDTDGPVFRYASRHSISDPLRNACKRAGVRYHSTHEIGRHSFATSLLKAGKSLTHVQRLGGWESGRLVSDRYGHLEREDAKEALEAIAARRSPKVRKV